MRISLLSRKLPLASLQERELKGPSVTRERACDRGFKRLLLAVIYLGRIRHSEGPRTGAPGALGKGKNLPLLWKSDPTSRRFSPSPKKEEKKEKKRIHHFG